MDDVVVAQPGEQLDGAGQRRSCRQDRAEDLAVASLDRFRLVVGEVTTGRPGDCAGEKAAAHPDPAVDLPALDRPAGLPERLLPGKDVAVDGVDEGPVEIEDEGAHPRSLAGRCESRHPENGSSCLARSRLAAELDCPLVMPFFAYRSARWRDGLLGGPTVTRRLAFDRCGPPPQPSGPNPPAPTLRPNMQRTASPPKAATYARGRVWPEHAASGKAPSPDRHRLPLVGDLRCRHEPAARSTDPRRRRRRQDRSPRPDVS